MIKAIFLAAGQSKRLKSENKLTKLYKKTPLINHSLKALQKSKVNKVIIVLGHEHKKVKRIIKKNKKNISGIVGLAIIKFLHDFYQLITSFFN